MARALITLLLIAAVGIGAWFYRTNSFSCGQFDSGNACLRSIVLDTKSLAIENPKPAYKAFDLSSSATQALVGLVGEQEVDGTTIEYTSLAIFDTETGQVLKLLRELWGTGAAFGEIALSQDGSLIASYGVGDTKDGDIENSLVVQKSSGEVAYVVRSHDDNNVYDCTNQLAFSLDNKFLQCGSLRYNLEEATSQRYSADSNTGSGEEQEAGTLPEYPRLANFSAGDFAHSATGVYVNRNKTNNINITMTFLDGSEKLYPRTTVFDNGYRSLMFSKDGQAFLDLESKKVKDQNFFQRIGIMPSTKVEATTLVRETQAAIQLTNSNFEMTWSHDSDYYALLGEDLKLSIFEAKPK